MNLRCLKIALNGVLIVAGGEERSIARHHSLQRMRYAGSFEQMFEDHK